MRQIPEIQIIDAGKGWPSKLSADFLLPVIRSYQKEVSGDCLLGTKSKAEHSDNP